MVRAIMIVEMAGRPAEHLKDALKNHIMVLDKVDDIKIHTIKISDPKKIETEKKLEEDIFTVFAEADFECDSFARLSETMFDFMPSSIEVIEPAKITMNLAEASDLLNNISGRMHKYDDVVKILGERYKMMEAQLKKTRETLTERDEEILKLKKGSSKKKVSKKKN